MDTNYKILMAIMGMEIGGAETHVLELAKELKRRGFDILVASNGGVYVKELEEAGIRHYKLPLHNKKFKNMFKSYHGLKKIIREEKVDIVHGHARIPSFLCGLLHRRMKFPFITTAHWVFNTHGILKYISNWGQKTIAVSNDIKKYLIDNYRVSEKDITVTINGIDTNKFSSDIDSSDVEREFDLRPDRNRIVYVSRMDDDRSLVAFHLVEIANELDRQIENLEIVIVGGGNSLKRLKMEAEAANRKAGRPLVKLTGPRTDINKFIKTGNIFVGVSRAVLEGMAAAKPVIVAGNEGYIGIFDEDKLSVSIQTNFTCRTCPASTKEQLKEDILTLMVRSRDDQLEHLGAYARQTIIDRYSVSRMAQDNIDAYESLLRDKKIRNDVLISGYYGFKNNGDDALLSAIIENLRGYMPEIKICVLSLHPKETRHTFGVKAVNRFNVFQIFRQMKGAHLLISGGGSLIQDGTSTHSLLYYLWIIQMAERRGLKNMLYANGIGPVIRPRNRARAKKALEMVDLITLRDPSSKQELKSLDVNRNDVILTADPAFSIVPANEEEMRTVMQRFGIPLDTPLAAIAVRNWKTHSPNFEVDIAKAADYLRDTLSLTPVFLNMQYPSDLRISKSIASKMTHPPIIVEQPLVDTQMLGLISNMDLIIGERLHTLIYAAAVGVPFVGIVYDPKVEGFMRYLGQDKYIPVDKLNFEILRKKIDQCVHTKENQKQQLLAKVEQMRGLSLYNAQLAVNLIKEKD